MGGSGTGVGEEGRSIVSSSCSRSASGSGSSNTGSGCDVCGISISGRISSASASGSSSCSGSAFFARVDLVVLAFFDLVLLARPAPAFRLALLVAVDAVDIVDITDMVLVSIDSSKSGMSVMLRPSDCVDMLDWVDNRVEAFDVLDAFDVRPFLAFGRLEGAVVPAKWKKTQSGALR